MARRAAAKVPAVTGLPYDLDAAISDLERTLNEPLDRLQALAARPVPQPDQAATVQAQVDLCQELERLWATTGHLFAWVAYYDDLARGVRNVLIDLARLGASNATSIRPELQAREVG